jgi:DNA repair ATPase RecN
MTLESEEQLSDLSASLIRTMIDTEVASGVKAVEDLLTEGLQAVFPDQDLRVRADVDVQRGKVSVDFVTIQRNADGTIVEGMSKDAFGGAVTTVQSILLRIIVTLRRGLRPILFLDETLPAFDGHYVHNMGSFLKTLSARLNVDILLVSHNPAMVEAADLAYKIQKVNGEAVFKTIRRGDA